MDVFIIVQITWCGHTGKRRIHSFCGGSGKRGPPFVHLRVTVGECKTCRAIVVGGRLINPRGLPRIEKSSVVDTAGVFIQIDPSLGRAWVKKLRSLFNVFVNGLPGASFGIAIANANVAGDAPGAFGPTPIPLRLAQVNVCWAPEDVLAFPQIPSQFREFILGQKLDIGVVG